MKTHLRQHLIVPVLLALFGSGSSVAGPAAQSGPLGIDCCAFLFGSADREPSEESESITLIVKGMMKSRSGAT